MATYNYTSDDFDDEVEFDEDFDSVIDCPQCGGDAYWNGSEYECDDCGWAGQS